MRQSEWPSQGGDVGALLRRWTGVSRSLGPVETWPAELKAAVQLILLSPAPMTLLWGRRGVLLYNDGYARIACSRHPEILGADVETAWPEAASFNRSVIDEVFAGNTLSYRDFEIALHRDNVAETVWLDIDYGPVLDAEGEIAGVLAVVQDKTQTMRALQARKEAERRLQEREHELAHVQRIGRVGGLEVDLREGFRNRRSPEYLLVHGLPPEAATESHDDWVARIHPDDRAGTDTHFRQAIAGPDLEYEIEYRIIRPSDRAIRWIRAVARIERDADGRALKLVGAHLDITERKEAEAQQRLLAQELSHRVKNSMAMIQAIASQTFRRAQTLDEAIDTFTARLAALAKAHDLLIRDGAGLGLREVIDGAVGIQGESARFTITGAEISLAPKPALSLALILHELTTNAVKYGALSNGTGRVVIGWRIDEIDGEPQFRLRWQEEGGPPVTPPSRQGFGSRLIERAFSTVQARSQTAYAPGGLVFTLDGPLSALTSTD